MDKSLSNLKKFNNSIEITEETDHLNIKNLWEDDTFMCRFSKTADFTCLNDIYLPPELAAIYNRKEKTIEYIYSPISEKDHVIGRKFSFYYKGVEFLAEFTEPSNALQLLSNGFREIESSSLTYYRNLKQFRDFYKKDTMPAYVQKYFANKKPVVFKIQGEFESINMEFVSFSKNLNFYLHFNDRTSPFIYIFEKEEKETYHLPCYSNSVEFPSTLNVRQIDPVLIDLFEVARRTNNTRLKFLFYFQVLEYCSYYHLNEEFKKRLTNIIKRPDLLSNSTYYGKLITEEFKDNFKLNDDSVKLERLLVDFINLDDIRLEITANHEYFTKDIIFDGGFIIPALISEIKDLDSPPKGLIRAVKTNIEKIRNVLVHIRESRENKVILPTVRNTNLLIPYLHLVQRIAEHIAIQYE